MNYHEENERAVRFLVNRNEEFRTQYLTDAALHNYCQIISQYASAEDLLKAVAEICKSRSKLEQDVMSMMAYMPARRPDPIKEGD